MGLFVDTVSTDVPIPELGIILVHPTTNYDLEGKFDAREIRDAVSLTTAITGGTLRWKKTSGGTILVGTDYDPDIAMVDEANLGTGYQGDRAVTFKDLTGENLTGASPGFTFGRSGNVTNAYLQNESVPSNTVGRLIMLDNAKINTIAIANEDVSTFDVKIYEHDGVTFTLKSTQTVTSSKTKLVEDLAIALTKGKMMAVEITNGAAKNPLVTVIVKGDI